MPGHAMKALGGTVVQHHSFLTWLLVGGKQSASHPGRLVPWTEPRFPSSRRLDGQMRLTDVKQTLKYFGLISYSSCTPLEIYASSRGYRQFEVSVLQFCDSLKTPSAEGFVGLNCLVGCTVKAEEVVGTSYICSVVQVVICVVSQSILFQTEITNVFKVCSTACEACA